MAQSSSAAVQSNPVAVTYAKAFLGAAQGRGDVSSSLEELGSLVNDVLEKIPGLEAVLGSKLIPPAEKEGLLERTLGKQASANLMVFLKVLVRHDRLDLVRSIYQTAVLLNYDNEGRTQIEVTTATAAADDLRNKLVSRFKDLLGKEPVVDWKVDPKVIGGLVLKVKDTVFDGSVATRLTALRGEMINRSVHEIQHRRDRFRHSEGN